jgi:hypothetical protein
MAADTRGRSYEPLSPSAPHRHVPLELTQVAPHGMRLLDSEEGRFRGVVTDELDVPFVCRYPLQASDAR